MIETSQKKGVTARFRYAIDVRRGKDKSLRVTLDNFTFLSLNGTDVTGKQWQEQLKPVLAATSALPAFDVSPRGEFIRADGFDEMIERVAPLLGKAEGKEQFRKSFASPEAKSLLQAAMGAYWNGWVGAWVNWPLQPGATTKEVATQALPTGARMPASVVRTFLGLRDGYATVELTTTTSGSAASRALVGLVNDLGRTAGIADIPESSVKDARIEITLLGELRPESLRPRHTRSERRFTLTLADGTRRSEAEIHDLQWNWDAAEGCGRQ